MPKQTAPLFSLSASGKLGGTLVYRKSRRQHIVVTKRDPANPRSPAQVSQRNWFLECIAAWHQLTPEEQQSYASRDPRIGANPAYLNFMHEWLVGVVPLHAPDHKKDQRDPLPVNDQPITDNIDMSGHRAANAGAPVNPNDYARKVDLPAVPPPDYPMKLKPALTRWVMPGWSGYWEASDPAKEEIYYIPIFVPETTTYIRIGVYVATSEPGTADLRIFKWEDGLPTHLILSAGTVNLGTTGPKEIVISQELQRAYYFLAIRATTYMAKLRGLNPYQTLTSPVAGLHKFPTGFPYHVVLTVSAEYADPAPAPTGYATSEKCFVFLREN